MVKMNQDKSAASVSPQAAAWVLDVCCKFYTSRNHKIVYNATTTEAKGKMSTRLKSL